MTQNSDTPIRDGSRDGAGCLVCGRALSSSRARYCSRAHQQRAFRLRHQTTKLPDLQRLRQDLQRRRAVAAQTIYECPSCGERLVGERRCPDCHLFNRAIGLGGQCPECDTPLLLVDLLGEEVVAPH